MELKGLRLIRARSVPNSHRARQSRGGGSPQRQSCWVSIAERLSPMREARSSRWRPEDRNERRTPPRVRVHPRFERRAPRELIEHQHREPTEERAGASLRWRRRVANGESRRSRGAPWPRPQSEAARRARGHTREEALQTLVCLRQRRDLPAWTSKLTHLLKLRLVEEPREERAGAPTSARSRPGSASAARCGLGEVTADEERRGVEERVRHLGRSRWM